MRRLRNLNVHEISLVKRAANKRKFLITKNLGAPMAADIEKIRDSLLAVPEPILKRLDEVAKSAFKKDDGTMMLSDDAQARLKAAGRMLQPIIGDISMDQVAQMLSAIGAVGADALMDSDVADDAAGDAVVMPDVDAAADAADDAQDAASDLAEATDDAAVATDAMADPLDVVTPTVVAPENDKRKASMQKALDASRAAYTQAMKDAGFDEEELNEEESPMNKSEVAKSHAPEAIAKAHKAEITALEKRHQEAVAKSVSLQLTLDKNEMVNKAAELPHLGAPEKMVDMLLRSKQKDPENFGENFSVLKSWNDAMNRSDIFIEHGSQASPKATGAEGQIAEAVAGMVQKSANLSPEQAYTQFISETAEGRALYRAVVTESFNKKGI